MIRIVHLSDFHLNQKTLFDAEIFIFKALKKDMVKFNGDKQIDFVVFSGDLIDRGGESFGNDIDAAFTEFEAKLVTPLVNAVGLPRKRCFFVPGNHDIKRDADDEIFEIGMQHKLTTTEKVNEFIDSGKTEGIERIFPYKNFEKEFHASYPRAHEITNYQSCFKAEVKGCSVGITCFNSAWRCYNSETDRGKIILGERQVINARKIIEGCDVKIGIIHHSPDWLADFDRRNVSPFIEIWRIIFVNYPS